MKRLMLVGIGFVWLGLACEPEDPCDRYVDYMCQCHEDDPGFDCQELSTLLQDADGDSQDQCAIDLANQRDDDEADGVECEV